MGDAHYSLVILGRGVENGPFFCLDVTRGSRKLTWRSYRRTIPIVGQWRLWKEFQAFNVNLSLQNRINQRQPTSSGWHWIPYFGQVAVVKQGILWRGARDHIVDSYPSRYVYLLKNFPDQIIVLHWLTRSCFRLSGSLGLFFLTGSSLDKNLKSLEFSLPESVISGYKLKYIIRYSFVW